MTQRRNILVTGYTGRLGGLTATALQTQHNVQPRVLVRPARLADHNWQPPAGITAAPGDFDNPASLDAALDGIEAVFLVSPVNPAMHARELALAERAAARSPAPHIVKISGLGTSLDSFVDSGRWHAEIERDMLALGLTATCLRPLFFMQNLAFQQQAMLAKGTLRGGVGDAAIAMVDARDIAAVAAAVLVGGTPIDGQTVSLTGPASVTYDEIAAVASSHFGREIRYVRQSLEEVRDALATSGQPQWHIDILLQFNDAFRQGWGDVTSDVVQSVLGRAPRTLDAYLAELAASSDGATGNSPFPS